VIEGEETLVGEHVKKLDYEERIAAGFRVHQPCERGGLLRVAAERGSDKVSQGFGRQRSQLDVLNPSGCSNGLQLAQERMRGSDFVVAVGTDEEKIAEVGLPQQAFQQVERCRVEPLEVIEEECERMFRPSEDADELPKHKLKTPLRVLWR
jgi:hypothetical protein